jgi:hypothetical protein
VYASVCYTFCAEDSSVVIKACATVEIDEEEVAKEESLAAIRTVIDPDKLPGRWYWDDTEVDWHE